MLNIYYGRADIDQGKFIYGKIREQGFSAERPVIVMVPDQFTVEAEKQAFGWLEKKAVIGLDIYGFSRLEHNIVKECGGGNKTYIDKYGREMLVTKVASGLKDELQVFGSSVSKPDFISMMSDLISGMKLYGATPETLDRVEKDTGTGTDALSMKLRDIKKIFEKYEEELEGKYTDSEDLTELCVQEMQESRIVRGSRIWIYGFDRFTPQYIKFIKAMMTAAEEVNVVLTYDENCADEELFEPSRLAMERIEAAAAEAGCAVGQKADIRDAAPECVAAKHPEIQCVERGLFSVDPEVYPGTQADDGTGVTLVEAANVTNEAESAAAYILSLVRDKGYRYRDIAVISTDLENNGAVIQRCFDEYGLPSFFDRKRSILNTNTAVFVLSILQCVNGGFRSTDIFKALKTGMFGIGTDMTDELENYVYKYRIEGRAWKEPFTKGTFEYSVEELAALNKAREAVMGPLMKLDEISSKSRTTRDFMTDFFYFLTRDMDIVERTDAEAQAQEDQGLLDLSQETVQVWQLILDIFDQIAELTGDEPYDRKSFMDLLTTGLTETEAGIIPDTPDDLLIGTVSRTMTPKVKAVLIIGANDGLLPSASSDDGILTAEELDRISAADYSIGPDRRMKTKEDELAIYRVFSCPSERLWISFSDSDAEGKSMRPSELIRILREMFPEKGLLKDVENTGDSMDLVGGRASTLRHYSYALTDSRRGGEPMDEVWQAAGKWFRENDQESDDVIASGEDFANDPEDLGPDLSSVFFTKNGRESGTMSPSQLEEYTRCPFRHFISYGLQPQERRVYEAAPRETGDVYHESIMKLTSMLTSEDMWDKADDSWITENVAKVLKEESESYRDGLFSYTNDEKYRLDRMQRVLESALKALIQQARAGDIKKSSYETPFGRDGNTPVVLEAGGRDISLKGKIDRVDILGNGKVKIIDYKTGSPEIKRSYVRQGYRLQLMAYLDAACGDDREPAGVFYFYIKEPEAKSDDIGDPSGIDSSSEKGIRDAYCMHGLFSSDPETVREIAGEFDESSNIIKVKRKKDGTLSTSTNSESPMMSEDELNELRQEARAAAQDILDSMTKGEISIRPAKVNKAPSCRFCDFKSICCFDIRFDGCSYNVIK
jgi:ATP-dependent helicase/nuclease subunit B